MRFRISILGGLWLVAFFALAMTALRSGSVVWITGMAWLLMSLLAASVLGVAFRTGKARVFWTGIAVFGWLYLILIHQSIVSTRLSEEMGDGLRALTNATLTPPPAVPGASPAARAVQFEEFAQFQIRVRVLTDLILNLGFAAAGGLTALGFAARTDAERAAAAPGPTPDGHAPDL